MARNFLSKSYDIENIEENKQEAVCLWLVKNKISHEFNATANAFEYVKLDTETAEAFQQSFPKAQVKHSSFTVVLNW